MQRGSFRLEGKKEQRKYPQFSTMSPSGWYFPMCPAIVLTKLLAQFDPEHESPSPPNTPLPGNQPKPTLWVQWAHRPRTKTRGVILQSQHLPCALTG